ncbi:TolC family protein [Campylobacter fetus]|uniref:Transporter n=4 Tax=Campylobacter fetus TaxID=196 RepID=A0AAX0HC08_CAMFE|nr:TolC family protein [Campylobacter fetus]AGZ81618.1 TolC-like outer membrane efflux protein [Campylobacter fetus subsp. testudinum 03-427]AJB45358.1 transporter [Campylobacter fetus subsp. testudinum]ALV64778.1 TolC-like outer membrane efflux protein [Campylobacter fetus subsp. testudinum Sp3]AVK81025.1 TolC family protein [Campylobacter fetus subsp. testudinum]EAI4321405.1 TolC family protein [Campylobacter fetus]
MKNIIFVLFSLIFIGCASKSLEYNVKNINFYEPSWYKDFNQTTLNNLVNLSLKNSEDINIAVLNLEIAMLKAGLIRDDFFPTPSGKFGASTNKDIKTSSGWKNGFSSEFALSYEVDIYGKIFDNYEARDWEAKASQSTLENLRLTIINSVTDTYFNILYLNDAIRNLKQNLENLNMLDKLVLTKYELGKEEILSVRQSRQNILDLQNQILSNIRELETSYEIIKNFTRSDIKFDDLSLSNVQNSDISLDIDFAILKNRPDINEAISNLNASFYDYKVSEKNLYPSVSIGASLSDSDSKFSDSFGFNILGGTLNINLPFLDYSRLKKQINISEAQFKKNVLTYEKTLSNAVNEVIKYVNYYEGDKQRYENMQNIKKEREMIVAIYESKYSEGKAELKDLLEAKNSLISVQNMLLNQKYRLLNDELSYYKAIAK